MTKNSTAPLVSVIMSVYNGEKYLEGCVDSILKQSFKNFEFIIVNDCSTDRSPQMLDNMYDDKRITILHNRKNIGLTKSLNNALRLVKSGYIARMDVDDISMPERLRMQYEFLEKNPEFGVVGSNYYEIDEDTSIIGEITLPEKYEDIRRKILRLNPFNHSAVMIRKSVLDNINNYNDKFVYAQDYELWLRLMRNCKGYNIQDKLLMKRNPKGSVTVAKKRRQIGFTLQAINSSKKYYKPNIYDDLHILKCRMIFITPQLVLNILRKARNMMRKKKYYKIRF